VLDRILQKNVRGDVDAEIAVEGVAVDGSAGDGAAVLPPEMNAIMMVGVGGRIPVGEVMEMIVMDAVGTGLSTRTGSDPVVHVIDVGIGEGEVGAVTGEGPGCVVAGDMVDGHVGSKMPVNAVDGVSGGKVSAGGANVQILNGEIADGAMLAQRGMNADRLG